MTTSDTQDNETSRQGASSTPPGDTGANRTREPEPAPKPSQAEGDRDTVEQDLRAKEAAGEL